MRVPLSAVLFALGLMVSGAVQAQTWSTDYFKRGNKYVRGYALDGCPTNAPVWETTDPYGAVTATNIIYTTNSTNGTVTAKTNVYTNGSTSILIGVKGWTFAPTSVDVTNNQSVEFGGYNIVQSGTFPGITNPSIYRTFTNPGGAVTFTADFAITRTADANYVGTFTNWDTFGFSFFDQTGATNLARIQFVPTPGTTNWYSVNWVGRAPNGTNFYAMTNVQRGSLYRMVAGFQGNAFSLTVYGCTNIQTNASGQATNYQFATPFRPVITNATIDNGLSAAQFERLSVDWLLKGSNNLQAGANYLLINAMSVSVAETAAPTPTLSTVALSNALAGTYGAASSGVSFIAAGTNLTGNITATAQTGYEVSTNQSSGYGASLSVAGGTTVWARFAATRIAGSYNNSTAVILSASGATNVNVTTSASNNAVAAAPLSITGLTAQDKDWDGTMAAAVTGTPQYSGLVNSESFPVGGTVTWAFPDASVGTNKSLIRTGSYAAPSANYTVTQPSLTASINAAVPSAPAITGITSGDGELSVAFSPPLTNGGAGITNYGYSTNAGVSWSACSPASTNSPVLITGLGNGMTYSVRLRAINSAGAGAASGTAEGAPVAPVLPAITASPETLPGSMSSTYGAASSAQSFIVAGTALGGNLTVAAPAGLQVSTNIGSGFASSLVLTQDAGTVGSTSIYVRLAASAAAGSFNDRNISVSGGGASPQNVATTASGNTVAPAELTVAGISIAEKVYDGTTLASIDGAAVYEGLQNGESFGVAGTPSAAFVTATAGSGKAVTVSGYAAPSSNYSVVQPVLAGKIKAKSLTVTGASVVTKDYDGNTSATITGAQLVGVVGQDAVSLTGATSGIFASAGAGSGIAVATSMGLTGNNADNYTLTQPTLTGNITTTSLTATVTLGNLIQAHSGTARSATATTDPAGLMVNFTYDGSATAPTNPGTYAVIGTVSDASYRGTAAGTLVIHGPAPAADFVTKANNTTQHRYSFADLLANDTRVTTNGTVLTNDGLTFVGADAGPGNSVSVRSSFVYFTPSTNSPETFTYQVTDGTTTNSATVTVAVAADTNVVYSTLQVVGAGTAAYDGINTTMTNYFIGVPNQTYGIQYKGELTNAAWDFAGATNSGASGSFGVRFQKTGNNAADWNGSMFFRGYLTNTNQ